jgi:hypothetical protein
MASTAVRQRPHGRHEDDLDGGIQPLDAGEDLDSVHAGHQDVEEAAVDVLPAHDLERRRAIGGFDDVTAVLEDELDGRTNARLVVDDEHDRAGGRHGGLGRSLAGWRGQNQLHIEPSRLSQGDAHARVPRRQQWS